jgi:hypothetical protein
VDAHQQKGQPEWFGDEEFKLRRWLVSFASGQECYRVGEFAAMEMTSAIDRVIDLFRSASD